MLPLLELGKAIDITLVPSSDCKTDDVHKKKFGTLMNCLGLEPKPKSIIETVSIQGHGYERLSFNWSGKDEDGAYEPLQSYLENNGIHSIIIGSGTGLPQGLLYNVDIYSLKKNSVISSAELRKTNEEPRLVFKLKGRTDLIVMREANSVICNANVKYYIEIKTVKTMKEESLREAVLQLIGGNVGALYHSPPVLLTNMVGIHYVLHIVQLGNAEVYLQFKLVVKKMETFMEALKFVEDHTANLRSVTRDFGRLPTPSASIADNTEDFGNSILHDLDGEDDLERL